MVNAISPSASGCLSDYSSDVSDPGICNTSFSAGETVSDSDVVAVGSAGTISTTNESNGPTDVSVTVLGYFTDDTASTAGQNYASVPQQTLVDTRNGTGAPEQQVPAGGSLNVQIAGADGIPADAAGAALFVGAADATASGYLSAYPAGGSDPDRSLVSYSAGEIVRDLYLGALSSTGQLTVTNHGSAPVDIVLNARGYFVSPTSTETGASYTGLTPARIFDSRNSSPLPAGGSVTFQAAGVGGVPSSGVAEVEESVAAIGPSTTGYLTVYPAGQGDPNSPTVNFTAGDNQDNDQNAAVVSTVSPTGEETISNHSSGAVNVVVSVRGYFSSATAPGAPGWADGALAQDGSGVATIAWGLPTSDGGAAITSYVATIYNPDGSVNQTDSYPGSATTATVSGLNASSSYTVGVAAVNGVGEGAQTQAPVDAETSGSSVTSSADAEQGIEMELDSSAQTLSLVGATATTGTSDANGNETSSTAETPDTSDLWTGPSSPLGSYSCVTETEKNSNFKAYAPWHADGTGKSYTYDYLNALYEVDDARYIYGNNGQGYWTLQIEFCTAGGGREALERAFRDLGVTWFERTANGQVALGRKAMDKLVERYADRPKVVELAATVRQLNEERTVYQTIENHLVGDRVHPRISCRQATGRVSITEPGLTVMGKRDGRQVEREVFLPDPGQVIMSADLSQIDARAVAVHAQDQGYLELFAPGVDLHAEIAYRIWGDRSRREQAKRISHGWNYGMGVAGISASAEVPFAVAEQFVSAMSEAFPRLIRWREETRERARAGEMLDNGFGRLMRPDPERSWTQATAFVGQGCARDLMMEGLLRLPAELLPMLRAVVHDEVVLSVPQELAEEVGQILLASLSFEWAPLNASRPVAIVAQLGRRGRSWADVYG